MQPVLPHIISECLTKFNEDHAPNWPKLDRKYLEKKIVKIVVQINGKKRGIIDCKKDIMQKDIVKIIEKNNEFEKYFVGQKNYKKYIHSK